MTSLPLPYKMMGLSAFNRPGDPSKTQGSPLTVVGRGGDKTLKGEERGMHELLASTEAMVEIELLCLYCTVSPRPP